MNTLLGNSWPYFLPGLLPILALLHVPLLGRRGRTVWAFVLGAVAVLFVGDVLVFDHTALGKLEVTTVFGQGPEAKLHPFVVETIERPVWQWHIATALWFGLTAAFAWLVRAREPQAPRPVPIAVLAFAWALAARIALEKTGGPQQIVWAVGVSAASFAIAVFFGWYCGARALGFGRLALALLLANALQRLLLVAVGYVATTRELGSHLDTHGIPEIAVPGQVIELHGGTHTWMRTLLVPQLTFALAISFVLGLVLAIVPWSLARRRAAAPAPA